MLDAGTGEVLLDDAPDRLVATASLAKVLLLIEVAARAEEGLVDLTSPVGRAGAPPVGDSGLWRHLRVEALPLGDVALLVGSVSDNLATNVLLDVVGLGAVADRARAVMPGGSRLHDHVRDVRGPADPPTLSTGCAADWSALVAALAAGTVHSPAVSAQVATWLRTGADLSMAAAAFGLDPLAHDEPDRGLALWHKTGTDVGVRAEAGLLAGPDRAVAYAVLVEWDEAREDHPGAPGAAGAVGAADPLGARGDVLEAMRRVGRCVLEWAVGPERAG